MTNNGERTVLNDRYEIQQRIGRGGMADVLLARDLLLDRPVAIKVLFAEFATDPNFVERFRREAQSAAALNHPNIVSVYDWGKYGGTYFIAMEYIEGRTLADIVRANGRVSPVQAAEIASEVSAALAFAHRNGVVHRDIKPANILIGSSGQVKVADFGIARAMNSAADSNLTQVGLVMGTATYFSPEQAQGAQPDPRSDLYSLGIVMYEMVGGRPPFAGDNPVAIAYKQVHENPQPLNQIAPDVPRPFEAIVAKLLAKNPAVRYPDGDSLRDDLRRFRNGEPVKALAGVAPPPGPPARPTGATTIARTVAPPRPNTGAVGAAGAYAAATATTANPNATTAMPRSGSVPVTGASPRPASRYPTGANEAVYYDPPQRRGWWGIAAFIAIIALAAGGFVLFKALNHKGKATTLALIDVTGQPLDQATAMILDAGLKPKAIAQVDPDAPEGVVFLTDPKPGVIVSRDQEIQLFFNPQKALLPVPDVTGHQVAEAKDILTASGFVAGTVTEVEDPSVPIGQVISQDPPALTPVKQATAVNLTVSQGAGKFTVSNVVGTPGDTAKNLLQGPPGNLVVTIASEANDTVPVGFVIRTEPGADTVVDKGSPITIVISTGPTQVEVPLLTGLLEGNARDLLAEKGLIADPVTFEDLPFGNVNVGRVVSQSVAVGQHVNSSSSIGLVIGRALPEVTTTTAAPTTTIAVTTTTAAPATTTTAAATTTTATTPPTGP